jgi:predicted RNA-binding Zn ribbon-like protein
MAPGDSTAEKTAPGALSLVQRFVNSVDLESGEDELTNPGALRDWLAERELMDAGDRATTADLRRAIDVREGLRALLLENAGLPLDPERVERLDAAVARAGLRMRFQPGAEPALEPDAGGVNGALGRLMAIVAGAVEDGAWTRMKACHRDPCFWAFYDRSKNRSGRWCKMEACGNIEKARAFRERHRAAPVGGR